MSVGLLFLSMTSETVVKKDCYETDPFKSASCEMMTCRTDRVRASVVILF